MTMGKKIKELRLKMGFTQEELGKKIGVEKATIYKYEQGIISNLKQSTIKSLAEILGVPPSYLMGWEDKNKESPLKDQIIPLDNAPLVPILGRVAAGIPLLAEENIEGYFPIPSNKQVDYALRVAGDSMEPEIKKGSLVLVKKQSDVDNGEIAVVLVNDSEATCKIVKKHDTGISLISKNQNYEPIFFTCKEVREAPVAIIGHVIGNVNFY